MALDAYAPCPCGSGKKFKWCCQPIHIQMDKAFRQEAEGQHETALRLMNEIIAEHPANPEPLGRMAQLLYQNERVEEAEETVQKALEINPKYPFGHLLQAIFRQEEGEIPGALMLLRKAADLYDPEARDFLARIYSMTAECELKLNRPVAGRAALQMAMHCQPANDELRKNFDEIFGEQSRLPKVARRAYTFQSPPASAGSPRRMAWDQALNGTQAKLSQAAGSFEQLIEQDPEDAAAWYNLGLARAWLGDNPGAVDALDRYVALEPDEARAAEAWALAEVLRCGSGMEDQANYLEHSVLYQVHSLQRFFAFLQQWEEDKRLIGVQVNQEQGIVTGLVLEKVVALTAELTAKQLPRLGAYLLVVDDHLRLWNTDAGALQQIGDELQQRLGPAVAQVRIEQGPVNFSDVLAQALVFPVQTADKEEARGRVMEAIQGFFEDTWMHRPLRSLGLVAPIDAASNSVLRKKLLGIIQFLQDCAAGGQAQEYDFDRLRHKLNLVRQDSSLASDNGARAADIAALSAAELAALPTDALADDQLEQAYQAALKLDVQELAGRFARSLVARPPRADRPDRFLWYAHLVQLALANGDTAAAMDYINEGQKADCEQNAGKRRNDYELHRGQVHARRGEAEQAQIVFDRLIERAPAELRYRGTAAEAMLASKEAGRALQFAQQGLAKAREKNDRDSEVYFMELVAAAQK